MSKTLIGKHFGEDVMVLRKIGEEYYEIEYAHDNTTAIVPVSEVTDVRRRTVKKNTTRQEERFKQAFYSIERVKKINSLQCIVCGATPSTNAHTRSRGAGGTWEDIVPMCDYHHKEIHRIGTRTFEEKYLLGDLERIAKAYAQII